MRLAVDVAAFNVVVVCRCRCFSLALLLLYHRACCCRSSVVIYCAVLLFAVCMLSVPLCPQTWRIFYRQGLGTLSSCRSGSPESGVIWYSGNTLHTVFLFGSVPFGSIQLGSSAANMTDRADKVLHIFVFLLYTVVRQAKSALRDGFSLAAYCTLVCFRSSWPATSWRSVPKTARLYAVYIFSRPGASTSAGCM